MTPDDAYAAGILDGEGSILMQRTQQHYWKIVVNVTSCDAVLVDWLHERYGGSVLRNMNRRAGSRLQHRWTVVGQDARKFLNKTAPMLLIKGDKARKAEEFFTLQEQGRGDGAYYTADQRAAFQAIRDWFDNDRARIKTLREQQV
jgi:hypothetical protein